MPWLESVLDTDDSIVDRREKEGSTIDANGSSEKEYSVNGTKIKEEQDILPELKSIIKQEEIIGTTPGQSGVAIKAEPVE